MTTPKKRSVKNGARAKVQADLEEDEDEDLSMPDLSEEDGKVNAAPKIAPRQSVRARGKRKSYVEGNELTEDE